MNAERMYHVLRAPVVTEKSSLQAEADNQVVFEVSRDASKPEIAQSVAALFDVTVVSVNTVTMPGKWRRFRGHPGKQSGWRKAYVTLAKGDEIDFLSGA